MADAIFTRLAGAGSAAVMDLATLQRFWTEEQGEALSPADCRALVGLHPDEVGERPRSQRHTNQDEVGAFNFNY